MSDNGLAQLLQIEQQVRRCETLTELTFVIVNMTKKLVTYEQAAYLSGSEIESTITRKNETDRFDNIRLVFDQ